MKIWDDRKAAPLAVLRPYDGQPVKSVTFLIGPHPQHIVLITGVGLYFLSFLNLFVCASVRARLDASQFYNS